MKVGLWDYHLNYHRADQVRAWVAELERLGIASIWVGEGLFRDPFTLAGIILSATERVTVAIGVANIWVRDAFATVAAQFTLAEAYPGRFLLGIGVSHAALVEGLRGHRYHKPLTAARTYLDDMDKARDAYKAFRPPSPPPCVLAALGPRMLELAAERVDGAHTYFVPPEHTSRARRILGPEKLLVPEQAVVLDDDPDRARRLARSHIRRYRVAGQCAAVQIPQADPRLDHPQAAPPAAADRWTWLVIAAHTQLCLARDLTVDLRRPWERPCPPGRLTPARVRRGFRRLRAKITFPARAPKPGRPGPGRPPSVPNQHRAPRHDVGKTTTRGQAKTVKHPIKG